jgi:hypothetical protein
MAQPSSSSSGSSSAGCMPFPSLASSEHQHADLAGLYRAFNQQYKNWTVFSQVRAKASTPAACARMVQGHEYGPCALPATCN